MAKFKKKKSAPTQKEPEAPEPEPVEQTPETEKPESAPEPPKKEKPIELLSDENKSKLNKLFWLRVALAIAAGTAATFIFEEIEGEERRWASIAFMIIIFIVTIVIAKSMKMQLPSSDRKKIVTQGIGSYIFLYLFIWIVSYTLVNSAPAETGVIPALP